MFDDPQPLSTMRRLTDIRVAQRQSRDDAITDPNTTHPVPGKVSSRISTLMHDGFHKSAPESFARLATG